MDVAALGRLVPQATVVTADGSDDGFAPYLGRVQRAVDPAGIMNPHAQGRVVDLTWV